MSKAQKPTSPRWLDHPVRELFHELGLPLPLKSLARVHHLYREPPLKSGLLLGLRMRQLCDKAVPHERQQSRPLR